MEFDITKFQIKNSSKVLNRVIKQSIQEIEELIQKADGRDFLKLYQEKVYEVNLAFTPISHFNSVKNTKISQKEYQKGLADFTDFHTTITQDERIYYKLKNIEKNYPLNREEKRLIENLLTEYELSGVTLDKDKKDEIRKINQKLGELSNNFFQNVLNDTNSYKITVSEEDIKDMPENDKKLYKKEKMYEFTLHAPSYLSFMTFCNNRGKREEMYKMYFTRGNQNSEIITEILTLRKTLSNILGYKNFAEVSLKLKDAKTPEDVLKFLYDLIEPCKKKALKEKENLAAIGKEFGIDEVKPYDLHFLSEKLKARKFGYKDEDFRIYFEKENVINGLFEFLKKIFALQYRKHDAKLWDKKVSLYEIDYEGSLCGKLFLDLEARKGKRDGAWMNDFEVRFKDINGNVHTPSAVIVANFPKSTSKIFSLLRPTDVETLFHEAGHALHHLLSDVDNIFVSGINGVKWDVVEFPSQFLENFFFHEDVLDLVAKHYKTGEKMPLDMKNALKEIKNFNSGIMFLRQLEFAIFDMEIHSKGITTFSEAHNVLKNVRDKVSVFDIPDYVKFENQFSHIFSGGYAAGYYSYKWAERLSADAFFLFLEKGVFDNNFGKRFVEELLSKGGSIDITDTYERFAGKKIDNLNLLKIYNIV
jgi:oligopeptidase A